MFTDFILNGQGQGPVAQVLGEFRFDPGMLRPYYNENGKRAVTINTGKFEFDKKSKKRKPIREEVLLKDLMNEGYYSPVYNATSLRKEDWIMFDNVVIQAARKRLTAWADLAKTSSFGGFNGMGKMILEHETVNDNGSAQVDMDGLTEPSTNDASLFQLEGLPLPITHSAFWFSQRVLAVSRNSGTPLDVTRAEQAGRRIAETIEQTLIGTLTGLTYGGNSTMVGGYGRTSQVYGYLNFPNRIIKTGITIPTGSNPEATVNDVLTCRDLLTAAKQYGPWMLYHSNDWDKWMDNDYARLGGNNASMTLRDRLRKIDGITDVKRLDYLDSATYPYHLLFVQMTPEVARAVNGLDLTTVQWESQGGFRLDFKTMCIWVPQLRADFYGNTGILQAKVS